VISRSDSEQDELAQELHEVQRGPIRSPAGVVQVGYWRVLSLASAKRIGLGWCVMLTAGMKEI